MDSDFLQSIKVGDKVAVSHNGDVYSLVLIHRITKTQFITRTGVKYRRDTGERIGSDRWSRSFLVEATEEVLNKIRHRALSQRLKDFDWSTLSLVELGAVANIVRAKQGSTL